MVASRGACLNRVQGTIHRVCRTHFDNSERPAGDDLCIYCVVGFGLRLSAPIRVMLDSRVSVAKWLAGKLFLRQVIRLRETRKSMNAALAKSESGAWRQATKPRDTSGNTLFLMLVFLCVLPTRSSAAHSRGR